VLSRVPFSVETGALELESDPEDTVLPGLLGVCVESPEELQPFMGMHKKAAIRNTAHFFIEYFIAASFTFNKYYSTIIAHKMQKENEKVAKGTTFVIICVGTKYF
jgi:hypothetical protein